MPSFKYVSAILEIHPYNNAIQTWEADILIIFPRVHEWLLDDHFWENLHLLLQRSGRLLCRLIILLSIWIYGLRLKVEVFWVDKLWIILLNLNKVNRNIKWPQCEKAIKRRLHKFVEFSYFLGILRLIVVMDFLIGCYGFINWWSQFTHW